MSCEMLMGPLAAGVPGAVLLHVLDINGTDMQCSVSGVKYSHFTCI